MPNFLKFRECGFFSFAVKLLSGDKTSIINPQLC